MLDLIGNISKSFDSFLENAAKVKNKSAARRARKLSFFIEKMLKEYRRVSLK